MPRCLRRAQSALGCMRAQHFLGFEKSKKCLDAGGPDGRVHDAHPLRICAAAVPKSASQSLEYVVAARSVISAAGVRERRRKPAALAGNFSTINPAWPAIPDP